MTDKGHQSEEHSMFRGRGGRGRGRGGRGRGGMEQRYGFFRCKGCQKTWESSHVYCRPGTNIVMFKQDCKDCNIAYFPYKTEPIVCSQCGLTECVCTDEELQEKRHINPEKPHLAHLCHKCRAGIPCQKSFD